MNKKHIVIGAIIVVIVSILSYFLFFPVFETDNFTPKESYVTTRSIYKRMTSNDFLRQYKVEKKVVINDTLRMLMLSNEKGFYRLNVNRSGEDLKSKPELLLKSGETIRAMKQVAYSDYGVESTLDSMYLSFWDSEEEITLSTQENTIVPLSQTKWLIVPREPNHNLESIDGVTSASRRINKSPIDSDILRDRCMYCDETNGENKGIAYFDGLVYDQGLSNEVINFSEGGWYQGEIKYMLTIPVKMSLETSIVSFVSYYDISYIISGLSPDISDCNAIYLTGDTSAYFSKEEIQKELKSMKVAKIREKMQTMMIDYLFNKYVRESRDKVMEYVKEKSSQCMSLDDLYYAFKNRTKAVDNYMDRKIMVEFRADRVSLANGFFDPSAFKYKMESSRTELFGEWISGYDVTAYTNDRALADIDPPQTVYMECELTNHYGSKFVFKNCISILHSEDCSPISISINNRPIKYFNE